MEMSGRFPIFVGDPYTMNEIFDDDDIFSAFC